MSFRQVVYVKCGQQYMVIAKKKKKHRYLIAKRCDMFSVSPMSPME